MNEAQTEETPTPLKGLRFEEMYAYYRWSKPDDVARKEAYQHIKTQNVIYDQDEYYE